jgi:hypothetical protein
VTFWPTAAEQREFARRHWADAVQLPDGTLDELLEAALPAVINYAPALPDDFPAPADYLLGLTYHARDLRTAVLRGEADVVGVGDYALRARPLAAAVKQLLRPQRGRPGIG